MSFDCCFFVWQVLGRLFFFLKGLGLFGYRGLWEVCATDNDKRDSVECIFGFSLF